MKTSKTNAMRALDRDGIPYEATSFEVEPEHLDAVTAANALGVDPEQVFKTLVLAGSDQKHYVAVIPGPATLDLKKAAAAFGIKSCRMVAQKELKPLTGYVHGGCSPIGMKKTFPTRIAELAQLHDVIYVSAGELGSQLRIRPDVLKDAVQADYADLCQE